MDETAPVTPKALQRLWGVGEPADRQARLGLSLERVVTSGIELADQDGLGAVSMKRVAERLGFTTMSLYRYVASKDELLLMMHDACWRPPEGLDIAPDDWRAGLEVWVHEQFRIIMGHPWLEQVRHIDRAGTPSQIMWMDLGLRALTGTLLTEYEKIEVLLVLSGYVFSTARDAETQADGLRRGYFEPGDAAAAFGELMAQVADPGRFPALLRAVAGGAFGGDHPFPDFEFGLRVILDGVEALIERAPGADG
jgi:AcrR family transcriptional regulator